MPYVQDPVKTSAKASALDLLRSELTALDEIPIRIDALISYINYTVGGSALDCDVRWRGYCEVTKEQYIKGAIQHMEMAYRLIENLSVMTYEEEEDDNV